MRIIDRYISKAIIASTLLALLVLLGLFALFAFIDEVAHIGRGDYTLGKAILYVVLQFPGLLYQLMPVAALLGSIVGLGILANNSELVVIRSSGVSLLRINWCVAKVGLLLIAIAMVMGEIIAPASEQYAERLRSDALSLNIAMQSDGHLWARDGMRFINIRNISMDGRLKQLYVYEIGEQRKLKEITYADEAIYQNDKWLLNDVEQVSIEEEAVVSNQQEQLYWNSVLSPELLGVVQIKPESLSISGLYKYINYLQNNELRSEHYELTFWSKLMVPIVTLIMLFLAIPFVFGSIRTIGMGHRILVGVFLGISLHILNQTAGVMGLAYNIPPLISAALPGMLFLVFVVILMKRIY